MKTPLTIISSTFVWVALATTALDLEGATKLTLECSPDLATAQATLTNARADSGVKEAKPGDVAITGTPEGVGELYVGDCVEVSVAGVGTLQTHIGAMA
ncbi:MAG: fumarylacetoacetate hydrolase family protein [Deinococcales bacterium]